MTWDYAQEEIARCRGFDMLSGLTPEQMRVQDQILELLPLIGEANAISEELGKHRFFVRLCAGDLRAMVFWKRCYVVDFQPIPN